MKATFGAFSWVRAVGAFSLFLVLGWGNGFAQSSSSGFTVLRTVTFNGDQVSITNVNGGASAACDSVATFCYTNNNADACCTFPNKTGNTDEAKTTNNTCANNTNPWSTWNRGACFRFDRRTSNHTYKARAYVAQTGDLITGSGSIGIVVMNNNVEFGIENLSIIGPELTVPISIGMLNNIASGNTNTTNPNGVHRPTGVKMHVRGSNFLAAGIGAAAIRVPLNSSLTIENGETDGSVSTLNAIGGSTHATSYTPFGAGIGGGFAYYGLGNTSNNYCNNTPANAQVTSCPAPVNSNRTEQCGTVTINGGKINAYGGSGIIGDDTTPVNGNSSGIGGYGNNCTLYINGGTVTASGGATGKNDIGKGTDGGPTEHLPTNYVSSTSTTCVTTGGTTTITGGSVNANICGGARHATENSTLSKYTFTIGNSAETGNKVVGGCSFTSTLVSVNQKITCNNLTNNANRQLYGINSVSTDGSGKVYFWLHATGSGLPNYTNGSSLANVDSINLLGISRGGQAIESQRYYLKSSDGTDNGTKITALGTGWQGTFISGDPSMRPPTDVPNSLVCKSTDDPSGCSKQGSYATGFRMRGSQHVAAVGRAVTLHIGQYIQKDGDVQGSTYNHKVRWYRTDDSTGCDLTGDKSKKINVAEGTFSSAGTTTYTPGLVDYGNYICAAVQIRDRANAPSVLENNDAYWVNNSSTDGSKNVIVYPPIKVGVVVTVSKPTIGAHLITAYKDKYPDNPNTEVNETEQALLELANSYILQSWMSFPEDNLLTNFTINKQTNAVTLSLNASLEGSEGLLRDLKYTWRGSGYFCKADGSPYTGSEIEEFSGSINLCLPNSCPYSDDPGSAPEGVGCFGTPTGDINLSVEADDGSQPKLAQILFCKEGTTCLNDGDIIALGTMGEAGIAFRSSDKVDEFGKLVLPEAGVIRLNFERTVENIGALNISTNGQVSLNPNDGSLQLFQGASGQASTAAYNYSFLGAGTIYSLVVSNFKNALGNSMTPATTSFRVEKQATFEGIEYTGKFIVGETINIKAKYEGNDGKNFVSGCYYLEYSNDNGSAIDFDETECNKNNLSSETIGITTPLKTTADAFGQYVRLVVRPTGTELVKGSTVGKVTAGAWKRIGVLLVPASDVTNEFLNVTIGSCDVKNIDSSIGGCQEDGSGYIVYSRNIGIRLTAEPQTILLDGVETFQRVSGWTAVGTGIDQSCGIDGKDPSLEFNCGNSSYRILDNSAIPSNGIITITPEIKPIVAPRVLQLSLYDISEELIDLKLIVTSNLPDAKDIRIVNNSLSLRFSMPVSTSEGTVTLTQAGTPQTLTCSWNDAFDICTVTNLFNEAKLFDTHFKITVHGFRGSGELMNTEQFFFITAPGPSVAITDWPNTAIVGTPISPTVTYDKKGGSDLKADGYTYVWERQGTIGAIHDGSTYTPTGVDFGSYIRFGVIAEDIDGNKGKIEYVNDWVRVGVKVIAEPAGGTCTSLNCTTTIGANNAQLSAEGVIVYENTPIRLTSSYGSDTFDMWETDGAPNVSFESAAATTNLKFASPSSGVIKIKGHMKDGVVPTIWAAQNATDDGFVFTFEPEDVKVSPVEGKTITISNGETVWTYTLSGNEIIGSDNTLELPYTSFIDYSLAEFTITVGARYVVGISEGAFKRGDNPNVGNANLLTFFGAGLSYAASPNVPYISKTGEYGNVAFDTTVVITNKSTGAVTFKASLENGSYFEITNPNSSELPYNLPYNCNVRFKGTEKLVPGKYEDVLRVDGYSGSEVVINDIKIELTFTIEPKYITITFRIPGSNSRPYNGTRRTEITDGEVTFETRVGNDDVSVKATSGEYTDAYVGQNKSYSIKYEITGDDRGYYTFVKGQSELVEPSSTLNSFTNGIITQKEISVKFSSLTDIVGSKKYDGTDTLSALGKLSLAHDELSWAESIDFNPEAVITLYRVNANDTISVRSISGFYLTGEMAGNYKPILPALRDENDVPKQGRIEPVSLVKYVGKDLAEYNNARATATYGDMISRYLSWEDPPEGDEVGSVAGNWEICDFGTSDCIEPKYVINNAYVNIAPVSELHAYFNARSSNFIKDVVVPVNLTVNPKPLNIDANLAGAGDRYGIKTYDGSPIITGIVPNIPINGLVAGDVVVEGDIRATAVFKNNDPNVGNNKPIAVTWAWNNSTLEEKYILQETSTLGTIAKREIKFGGIEAYDKEYDGNRNVVLNTGTNATMIEGRIGDDIVSLGSLSGLGAEFENSNVCWNETTKTECTVNVLFTANISLIGAHSGNYTPVIEPAQAKILQADLKNVPVNNTTVANLKSEGTYGDHLYESAISTRDDSKYPFPRQLKGKIGENVSGIWSWENDGSELVGNATAIGFTSCGSNHYTVSKTALFEGQNDNYKPYDAAIGFCVLPRRVQVKDPENLVTKVYDRTTLYHNFEAISKDTIYGSILENDNVTVRIDTAFYNSQSAGTDRIITVKYGIEGSSVANYLPPVDKVQPSMTISKRPVSIVGLSVEGKYYDGTTLLNSPVIGSERLQLASDPGVVNAGVIEGDNITLNKNGAAEWHFSTPNAGDSIVVYPNSGAFSLVGSPVAIVNNYELVLDALKANIYKFSLAHYLCEEFTTEDCSNKSEEEKDKLILLPENLIKTAQLLIKQQVRATYGDRFIEDLTIELKDAMPVTMGDLFKINIDVKDAEGNVTGTVPDPTSVVWSWEEHRLVKNAGALDTGKATFSFNNPNYGMLGGIPIPISISKRPLGLSALNPVSRGYDTTNVVEMSYRIENIADKYYNSNEKEFSDTDRDIISVRGYTADENASTDKSIVNVVVEWGAAATISGVDTNNYMLPVIDVSDVGTVNIAKIPWPGFAADPIALPAEFVYDTIAYPSLSTDYIKLSEGWDWAQSVKGNAIANPHIAANNSANAQFITEEYEVSFAPPEEFATNYLGKPGTVNLTIRKRSEDTTQDTAFVSTFCGASSPRINVKAKDPGASIWYGNSRYGSTNEGSFVVDGLADYKTHKIYYAIQAQAYGPEYRRTDSIDYVRYIPFEKVAYWIREKALTVNLALDSTETYLSNYSFDLPKTKWFSGTEYLGEGRSMPVSRADGDYSLILTTTTGEEFATCKDRGGFPEVTPINKERKVHLVASSFGAKVVMGGTNLEFNTPFGGIVSIYTLKGELVSKMNAVDTRTVVKIPSAHGMYIVKLEAKK